VKVTFSFISCTWSKFSVLKISMISNLVVSLSCEDDFSFILCTLSKFSVLKTSKISNLVVR
jgi:hypothetical protein